MLMRGDRILLSGADLDLESVEAVARRDVPVCLSAEASDAIEASARRLVAHVAAGRRIYGLTTGVGALDRVPVSDSDGARHQRALLVSHAAGVGRAMADDDVRAMLLCRVNTLAAGLSGIRPGTVSALVALLNEGLTPVVPERGSVGASDLAPLAHAALPLIGRGRVRWAGEELEGAEAMRRAGIALPDLGGRDALALINGLAQTVGVAALAVLDAERLVRAAELAGAMGAAAAGVVATCFDARTVALKRHVHASESAARIRALLGVAGGVDEPQDGDFREPLSVRTMHHVAGAAREAVAHGRNVVEDELNAAVDNPVVADGWVSGNAASFDGHRVAQALDLVSAALVALAAASERRTARLLDPGASRGLPAFLVHPDAPAGSSGFMVAQCTAASLVAELRMGAVPSAGQTIPTSNGFEDVVSMSAVSARRLRSVVDSVVSVVTIETLCSAQALDLSGRPAPSEGLSTAHRVVRQAVPQMIEDRPVGRDVATVQELLRAGRID